jgi:hypothetical protein
VEKEVGDEDEDEKEDEEEEFLPIIESIWSGGAPGGPASILARFLPVNPICE